MDDCEEDYKSFYKILEANCQFKHPGNTLPNIPWFLKSCRNQQVSSILKQTLSDSKFDAHKFQNQAALLLLLHRSQKANHMMRKDSLLKENLDIRTRLNTTREYDSKSRGRVCFIEGKSEYGELSITLDLGGEVRNIGVGEEFEGYIQFKNNVFISIYTAIGEESIKIDEISLYFRSALENVHYLNWVDKKYCSFPVEKRDEKYMIILEATLFLCDADKREILMQIMYDNELTLKTQMENDNLYESLLKELGIIIIEDRITSAFVAEREREHCCNCNIL